VQLLAASRVLHCLGNSLISLVVQQFYKHDVDCRSFCQSAEPIVLFKQNDCYVIII